MMLRTLDHHLLLPLDTWTRDTGISGICVCVWKYSCWLPISPTLVRHWESGASLDGLSIGLIFLPQAPSPARGRRNSGWLTASCRVLPGRSPSLARSVLRPLQTRHTGDNYILTFWLSVIVWITDCIMTRLADPRLSRYMSDDPWSISHIKLGIKVFEWSTLLR